MNIHIYTHINTRVIGSHLRVTFFFISFRFHKSNKLINYRFNPIISIFSIILNVVMAVLITSELTIANCITVDILVDI